MKKKVLAMIAVFMLVFLAGCGGKGTKNTGASEASHFNADALMEKLLSEITYTQELEKASDEDISFLIELPDGVQAVMYKGSSGRTAEEAAIFTAPDKSTAQKVKDNVQLFLDDQKASFQNYVPEEVKRIQDAVLVVRDNYVILCVSGSSEEAKQLIENAFNGKK